MDVQATSESDFERIMSQRYLSSDDIAKAFMINKRAARNIKKKAIESFNGACPLNAHIVLKDAVIRAIEDIKNKRVTQHQANNYR
jgi:hypothetical protein